LQNITGKGLFISTVSEGLIDDESLLEQSIKVIKIEDNIAHIYIIQGNQELPFEIRFVHKSKQWKIDLTSYFPMSTLLFSKFMDDNSLSENQFVFKTIGLLTDRKVTSEIWQPTNNTL